MWMDLLEILVKG